MAQKPLLWVEVGAHAVRNRSKCGGVVWAGVGVAWRHLDLHPLPSVVPATSSHSVMPASYEAAPADKRLYPAT
jgi:hypothetical protein